MVQVAAVTMMIKSLKTNLLRGTENNRTPYFFGGDFLYKSVFLILFLMITISACSPSPDKNSLYDDLSRTFHGEKVLEGEQLTDIFRSQHSKEKDFHRIHYKFEKEES